MAMKDLSKLQTVEQGTRSYYLHPVVKGKVQIGFAPVGVYEDYEAMLDYYTPEAIHELAYRQLFQDAANAVRGKETGKISANAILSCISQHAEELLEDVKNGLAGDITNAARIRLEKEQDEPTDKNTIHWDCAK